MPINITFGFDSLRRIADHSVAALTAIGVIATGTTALAFVVGSEFYRGYFSELGAQWITRELPPADLLRPGISWLLLTALMIMVVLCFVAAGTPYRQIKRLTTLSMASALIIGLAGLLGQSFLPNWIASTCLRLAAPALAIVVALMIANVIVRAHATSEDEHLRRRKVALALVLLILVAIFLPGEAGLLAAQGEAATGFSGRPVVKIHESEGLSAGSEWRMIHVFGDKAVVMRLVPDRGSRIFKVVDLTAIEQIERDS